MPDMERLTDQLSIDMAKTPQQKSYAKGFVDGKKRARIEVAFVVVTLYFAVALLGNLTQ